MSHAAGFVLLTLLRLVAVADAGAALVVIAIAGLPDVQAAKGVVFRFLVFLLLSPLLLVLLPGFGIIDAQQRCYRQHGCKTRQCSTPRDHRRGRGSERLVMQ